METRYRYGYVAEPEDGVWVISFPGVRGANSQADSEDEIAYMAEDCIITLIESLMASRYDLPAPVVDVRSTGTVDLPVLLAAKAALYTAMREQQLSNVALAKRIGVSEGTVRRLVDPRHASKIESVTTALGRLGQVVTVSTSRRPPRAASSV